MKQLVTKKHEVIVELQEKALKLACARAESGEYVMKFDSNDIRTKSDEIATSNWYEGMYVHRSYMYCKELRMTFFYDENGKATYTYSGRSNDEDTLRKLTKAFTMAEQLREAMDDVMDEMIDRKNAEDNEAETESENDDKANFIGQKYSNTCFMFGEVRSVLRSEDLNVYYAACIKTIDLKKYSKREIDDALLYYYEDVDNVERTFKEHTNQIIALCLFRRTKIADMDLQSGWYVKESSAQEALSKLQRNNISSRVEWDNDGDLCVIEKTSDTSFCIGEVRTKVSHLNAQTYYIFCVKQIDLNNFSEEELEVYTKPHWKGGVNEVRNTFGDRANLIIAKDVFISLPTYSMDYISDRYGSKVDAKQDLSEYATTYLEEQEQK